MTSFKAADIMKWTSAPQMPYIDGKPIIGQLQTKTALAGLNEQFFCGVSTDSRSLKAGEIFIALIGANFDGHDFLSRAVEVGAGMLIARTGHPALVGLKETYPDLMYINQDQIITNEHTDWSRTIVLEVHDTLIALQQIACGYRHQLTAKVIAVTGSVGKTSTREMISCCLAVDGKVHQTEANLNNEIGLPQTLLAAEQEHDYIVLEMGMRGLGQIELLSKIACPDISVITNIGWSHLELLGSRENILKAKTEITAGMRSDGILIINHDDEMLAKWHQSGKSPVKTVYYSASMNNLDYKADIWAEKIETGTDSSSFVAVTANEICPVEIALPGSHHISNALAGLLTAQLLGIKLTAAAACIRQYKNTGQRQRIIRVRDICIMDDTYNAAPESMITAIKTIASMAGGQRIVGVFAGMLELGNYSDTAHQLVGRAAAAAGFQHLFLLGALAVDIEKGARQCTSDIIVDNFDNREELASSLKAIIRPGDYILVKGSRAFAMDEITAELEAYLEE